MQLGTEIGKMTGKYLPGSRKTARGCSTQATEWQRIGDQIDAAFIFARPNFVIDKVMVQALMRWRANPGPMRAVGIYWSFGTRPWVNYGKSSGSQ